MGRRIKKKMNNIYLEGEVIMFPIKCGVEKVGRDAEKGREVYFFTAVSTSSAKVPST